MLLDFVVFVFLPKGQISDYNDERLKISILITISVGGHTHADHTSGQWMCFK